jgi:hypothetical protein
MIHWGDSMEFSPFVRYRTIRQLAFIFGVGMVPGAVLCADQTTKDAKSTQEIGFTLDRTRRPTLRQQLLMVHIYDQGGLLRKPSSWEAGLKCQHL